MKNFSEIQEFNQIPLTPCIYKEKCSGCTQLSVPYSAQAEQKKQHLQGLFTQNNISQPNPVNFYSVGSAHLRDRLDFTLEEGRLGLYQKHKHTILDLEHCAQLSPALQGWLTEFRQVHWPFAKGSIRLRVGPQGQKGVWLDLANIDIKYLLEEKNILKKLLHSAFVEIGQRRKIPFWTGTEFKLKDPEMHVWFQTWMNDRPVDLFCQIASFTQPSLKANRLICQQISSWIEAFPKARVLEFGSGIGNLTLPALFSCESLVACEIDKLSLAGLQRTLENLPPDLQQHQIKISIHAGDFQKKLLQDFSQFDVVLANPPRSGLMNFINPLAELPASRRPQFFIYMSCYPESLAKDLSQLQKFGYSLQQVSIVDQFPQTDHYEVLTLLERKEL